jgi:flagellar hook-associated protein 1 FlgK
MLGLIGTLEMSKRSLDTNRQAIELTGHNLSNVSNPAYARQRLKIQTAGTLPGPNGPTGTGAVVAGIEQIRSKLLDSQIAVETSVTGFLEAKQQALQFGEVNLGQQLDRQASTPEAATAALGVGGQFGLVEGLSDFFNSWQALSAAPNSTADRQVVLLKAENLADKFNSVNTRLDRLRDNLNQSVSDDVTEANLLITDIADLSTGISSGDVGSSGNANDLRDRRQGKIESLARLVNLQTSENPVTNGFNLTINGISIITESQVVDTLSTYTDSSGGTQIQTASGTALTLTSGSMQGTINARDGALTTITNEVNTLAGSLITKVNTIHAAGFALDGVTTGQNFFDGTDASDMRVNSVIRADSSLIQASATGDPGDNGVALSLAQLSAQPQTNLGNLTFSDSYNQSIANFGQALSNVNSQLQDQEAVNRMLAQQRDSIGGVSIDEEMSNLVIFQRAFQASAKMINTVDELLQTVIALSR